MNAKVHQFFQLNQQLSTISIRILWILLRLHNTCVYLEGDGVYPDVKVWAWPSYRIIKRCSHHSTANRENNFSFSVYIWTYIYFNLAKTTTLFGPLSYFSCIFNYTLKLAVHSISWQPFVGNLWPTAVTTRLHFFVI